MVQQLDSSNCPASSKESRLSTENEFYIKEPRDTNPKPQVYRRKIVWFNALGFLALHLTALYAIPVFFTEAHFLTIVWMIFLMHCSGMGITMGAHRLFSHKAFKAVPMLRLFLIAMQTMAGQNCLYVWVRDHRQHHKYSDTDADPHNSSRGFFFSHIGWLMVRKHPDVISKGKTIDMSDLEADPLIMFQKRYYKTLYVILALVIPTVVPVWLWGETIKSSFLVAFLLRTVLFLNFTWLVNSYAHIFGTRPYTRGIVPVEAPLVSMLCLGEGWHNYHHTFPWDYKAAELGQRYNLTTILLDVAAKLGWAYDLRSATPGMVLHRVLKWGDGTHPNINTHSEQQTPLEAKDFVRSPGF